MFTDWPYDNNMPNDYVIQNVTGYVLTDMWSEMKKLQVQLVIEKRHYFLFQKNVETSYWSPSLLSTHPNEFLF